MKTNFAAKIKQKSTVHMLALSFLSVITIGTFALLLPYSTYESIEIVDAAFISVSAVCVTGLSTVDVSTTFTVFGKIIIMLLIQFGGLGIMTFAACAVWILREKLSVNERMMLEQSFIQGEESLSLKRFIFFLVKYTFFSEAAGTICYFFAFSSIKDFWNRIFFALFHSVSAFCNAGFSLYSDSFMQYKDSWAVNTVTCLLIILGGIGFIVVFELRNKFAHYLVFRKRKRKRTYKTRKLTVHTWLVLRITCYLIISGTIFIYLLQRSAPNCMNLTLLESFFQSVTCRTAGFNTVNIGRLHHATLIVMVFLMFVGGSPGSAAGGIKTTTFGVLCYIMFLSKNNFNRVTVNKRTVPHRIIYQAMLVLLFSIFIVFISFILLSVFQPEFDFIQLFFETVSAFGTVGLSTGITAELFFQSKCILMITMFTGRVGPLSIFSIIASSREEMKIKYVEEKLLIG